MGVEATRFMHAGELVPDGVILGIIGEALQHDDSEEGFLLDGFPRTEAQAEGLQTLLADKGLAIDAIVNLVVDDAEIGKRLSTRGRKDDTVDTIGRRIEVYQAETRPVLEWYGNHGVRIVSVEGVGDIESIQAHILERLGL